VLTTLLRQQALSETDVAQVTALVNHAERVDGVSPLNDETRLALHHDSSSTHLLARHDDLLVGYAQLQHLDDAPSAVLAVDPEHRRTGIGRQILDATQDAAAAPVGFWSFRALPAAAALARAAGLTPVRELLVMGLDLKEPISVPDPAAGVTLRTFRVGVDEDEWLRLNARAFQHHPEQGRMTLQDLEDREAEAWFDPKGFLLAVQEGAITGFHWTKQHSDGLGEVYVLGVDPEAGGRGLGTLLLAAGLAHLQGNGCTRVQLYVEADHQKAVNLYRHRGFSVTTRDVMYAHP
jgi:mycothiol synthase